MCLNHCLSTLDKSFSAFTVSAMPIAGRILASYPDHSDIKMFVQDTGREFPFLEFTLRKSNCWISRNQAGSKFSALKNGWVGLALEFQPLLQVQLSWLPLSFVRADSFSRSDDVGIRLNRNINKSISFQGSTPYAA